VTTRPWAFDSSPDPNSVVTLVAGDPLVATGERVACRVGEAVKLVDDLVDQVVGLFNLLVELLCALDYPNVVVRTQ